MEEILNESNYWIIPANPKAYNSIDAFSTNEEIDWAFEKNSKIQKGDIVFIYLASPYRSIAIKAAVTKNNVPENEILDDKKYWVDGNFNFNVNRKYCRLKRIKLYDENIQSQLSYEKLQNHGLNNTLQNYINLNHNNKLLTYILTIDSNGELNMDTFKSNIMNINNLANEKNLILYGPPGTGKTFNVMKLAVELIDGESNGNYKKRFNELKESGQIEFITFHQSYSYEEFVEGIKAESDGSNIRYDIKDGIFKEITKRAKNNFIKSQVTIKQKPNIHNLLNLLFKELQEGKEKVEFLLSRTKFYVYDYNDKTIYFEKAGGSRNHSLSIVTLNKMYEKEMNDIIISGLQVYYDALLEQLLLLSKKEPDKELKNDELKKFVLIIDEINRGNISKILGELITLIENDKRLGKENELTVTLPYSGESFCIPSNLYIIGTMNTADHSIALVDTALRRRFTFIEMMPDYTLLSENIDGINLRTMLETMNQRIEYLIDRDHQIGHAYFVDIKDMSALANVFKNKIIPLLQEYFYNEWEKIQLVLGDNKKIEKGEQFIIEKKDVNYKILFGENIDNDFNAKKLYGVNEGVSDNPFINPKAYINIYKTGQDNGQ